MVGYARVGYEELKDEPTRDSFGGGRSASMRLRQGTPLCASPFIPGGATVFERMKSTYMSVVQLCVSSAFLPEPISTITLYFNHSDYISTRKNIFQPCDGSTF
jgi:hypothetical protein